MTLVHGQCKGKCEGSTESNPRFVSVCANRGNVNVNVWGHNQQPQFFSKLLCGVEIKNQEKDIPICILLTNFFCDFLRVRFWFCFERIECQYQTFCFVLFRAAHSERALPSP